MNKLKRPGKLDDTDYRAWRTYSEALESEREELKEEINKILKAVARGEKLDYDIKWDGKSQKENLEQELQTLINKIAELNRTMPEVEPTAEMVDWCDKLEQLTETN